MIVKNSELKDDGFHVTVSLEDEGLKVETSVIVPTWRAPDPHAAGLTARADLDGWAEATRWTVGPRRHKGTA